MANEDTRIAQLMVPVRGIPASLKSESALPTAVAFTPEEQQANVVAETSEATRAQLEAAIASEKDPKARAALQATYDQDFGGKAQPGTKPPTWDEVLRTPEMQNLSGDQLEQARNAYFVEVVAPLVPTDQIDAARAAFDSDTKPGVIQRGVQTVKDTLGAIRNGVSLSPETLDQLERGYRTLKQGVFGVGRQSTQNLLNMMDRVDAGERVPDIEDPLGYQFKTPEQRAALRAKLVGQGENLTREIAKEQIKSGQLYQNPAAQETIKAANEGRWGDAWTAFAADPAGAIKDLSLSNMAQIVPAAGGGVAGAMLKGIPGFLAGVASGSLPIDYAMSIPDFLQGEGVDLANPAAVDAAMQDPTFFQRLGQYATMHAAAVTAADTASAGLMKPLRPGVSQIARNIGVGARNLGVEVGGEMLGEGAGQAAGRGNVQMGDVLAEGLAAGPMAAANTAGATVANARRAEESAPEAAATPAARAKRGVKPAAGPVSADDMLGKADAGEAPAARSAAPQTPAQPAGKEMEVARGVSPIMSRPEGESDIFANPDPVERTEKSPKFVDGRATTFSTERGAKLDGRFAVADLDELTVSHDINFKANADYPAVLQPRDRSRAAYGPHIEAIVNRLNPDQLAENPLASHGAPIVGEDGITESGNGRLIALRKAYNRDGEPGKKYRAWLEKNAQSFGVDPAALAGMKRPVLVRVRTTPVNRAEFARQANAESVARMSALEQAKSDAARMGAIDDFSVGEGGEFTQTANTPFIRRFVAGLPGTEQTDMVDSKGRLSQAGYTRIRNAVLARAYGDSETLMRLVESVDDSSRNITKALLQSAPRIAKLREDVRAGALHDLDITPDLVAAVEELTRIREEGKNVGQVLAQLDLLGGKGYSPETVELLQFLDDNIRAPRRIAQLIENYLQGLESRGSPSQGSMFDEAPPTKREVLEYARKGVSDEEGDADARPGEAAAGQPQPGAAPAAQGGSDGAVPGAGAPAAASGAGQPAAGKQPERRKPVAAQGVKPKEEGGAKHPFDFSGAMKGVGKALSDDLFAKAFDALKSGKDTIAGVRDPILARAKAAFDGGLIKSPDDIRRFERDGYPTAEKTAAPKKKAPAAPKKKPAAEAVDKAFGAGNKVFTKSSADAARELLKKKLSQLNSGIDPEIIQAGIQLAGYYIEGGARRFADYTAKMVADLGEGARPFLKSWYLAVRNYPGFDNKGMESEADIDAAEKRPPEVKKEPAPPEEIDAAESLIEAALVQDKFLKAVASRDDLEIGSADTFGGFVPEVSTRYADEAARLLADKEVSARVYETLQGYSQNATLMEAFAKRLVALIRADKAPEKPKAEKKVKPLPANLQTMMEAANKDLAPLGFELRPTDWTEGIGMWWPDGVMGTWDTLQHIKGQAWFDAQIQRARDLVASGRLGEDEDGEAAPEREPEEIDGVPADMLDALEDASSRDETHHIKTPERQALRKQIEDKLYGTGAKVKGRRLDIVMGLPASGKSSAIVEPLAEEHGALIVDADRAKEELPEYDDGIGAHAVHEESSDITKEILYRAVVAGDNIVYPTVGRTIEKLEKLIREAKAEGYTVHITLVRVPVEEAVRRAVARFRHTGRLVDPRFIRESGLRPQGNFAILELKGLGDSYAEYSNDVEQGQKPVLIREKGARVRSDESRGSGAGRSGGQAEGNAGSAEESADGEVAPAVAPDESPAPAGLSASKPAETKRTVAGFPLVIEQPTGSTRSGKDRTGKEWSVTMTADYGRFDDGSKGADGEPLDFYMVPGTPDDWDGIVFVVDQGRPSTGKFDEQKVILGAGDYAEANALYDAHFSDGSGPQRRITTGATLEAFRDWLERGDPKRPFWQFREDLRPETYDFVSTFPFPLDDPEKPTDMLDESPIGEEHQALAAVHEEQANEMLGYLRDLDAVKAALKDGTDPATGKKPKTPAARAKVLKQLQADEKRLPEDYQDALAVYAEEFGLVAADRFDKFLREKYHAEKGRDTPALEQDADEPANIVASDRLADWVADKIKAREAFTSKELFAQADRHFGGSQAAGTYTPKDAYDAMELGVNRAIERSAMTLKPNGDLESARAAIEALRGLLDLLPTQTKRTQEQDEFQQFSTPPTYAYVVNWAANIREGETYLEPSGGVGGLAIFGKNAGAHVIVNELAPRRAGLLRKLGFSPVYTENAEQLNNILPADVKPTVVVMNPPFSASAGRMQGKRDTKLGAGHIEQALKRLQPRGRLVAIVGEGMAADRPAFKAWWDQIKKQYAVRANIGIDGKGYAKYGTTFDNQILVIDKTGPTTTPPITGKVATIDEVLPLLEGIRNDRPESTASDRQGERRPAQPGGKRAADEGRAPVGERGTAARPQSDGVGSGGSGDLFAEGVQPVSTGSDGAQNGRPAAGPRDGAAGEPGGRGASQPGRDGARGQNSGAGGNAAADDAQSGPSSNRPVDGSQESVQVHATEENPADDKPLTDSVYEAYRPQRLSIPGAKPHLGKLVQSAAMASVLPPAPTYTPNLQPALITTGKLSLAQLETTVYAGQAHEQFLPGGERKGFFIGDGTGVGKGREISGIVLDNMRRGRTKAVWISKSSGLVKDAKRDYGDVGGTRDDVFDLSKTKAGDRIKASKGILFTTYSTLRSKEKKQANDKGGKEGKRRLDQIAEWLGKDFDGVIAFDEAHQMGNALPMKAKRGVKQASQQALAGIELQAMLPKARVVYVSATGATEVVNLSYATRLGLWGPGTPFATVQHFVNSIDSGGLAAMELVSRDMKAMGLYLARSLSYDGVTYSRVEHELTPVQTDIYNELARAWQVVLSNVQEALGITNQNRDPFAKSAALSAFWGAHQRFFNQIITSMQMPSVVEEVERDLQAGHAVVMQLVNTNEATQTRQLAAMQEGDDLEDLDLTPRENLIQYVRNSYPIQQYEIYLDDEGRERARPVVDSAGNPVFNQEAIAERERIIGNLEAIRVPDGPLEIIINHFGPDVVAEVTGRKQRVVRVVEEGREKTVIQKRGKSAAAADADAFMDDKRRILIFSDAGGTGYSFHADNTKKNRRRRMHYLVQPGWRADAAVQGFGRSHRTNQASEPEYKLVSTNLKAQKRFISSIARRLDQLGALTKGQRQTGSQGLFSAKDNLESQYAEDAVYQLFRDIHGGRVPELPFVDTMTQLGFEPDLMIDDTGNLNDDKIPDVPKFLNRLLSLTTDMQDKVFDAFSLRMDANVEEAIRRGTLDFGMETLRAKSIKVRFEAAARTDEATGAETKYVELELTHDTKLADFPNPHPMAKWYKNKTSGKVWRVVPAGTVTTKDGTVVERFGFSGTGSGHYGPFIADKFDAISEAEARQLWDAENAARPKEYTEAVHMLTGLLLPIWDRITGHIRVARAQTDDGKRILGRVINPENLADVLKNLGVGSSVKDMPTSEVMQRIMGGEIAVLSNQWRVVRSRVSNENRIEVKAGRWPSPATIKEMEGYGAFVERIQFEERIFIPTGEKGEQALAKLLKVRELVDFVKKGDDDTALSRAYRGGVGRIDVEDAKAVAKLFRAKLKGMPEIHVLEAVKQAPEALRRDIKALGGELDTAGAWHDGEVYLFAENLQSPEHAAWVILHEGTHHGLRGMFGAALNPVLMDIYLKNRNVRAAAEKERSKNRNLSTVAAVEEVLANMGGDGVDQSIMDRLVAFVRRLIRSLGVRLDVTDNDVKDLVRRALDAVKRPPTGTQILSGSALHTAWHGSPHDFDAFSLQKIGTGEGVQAYGWGLYFAGRREVAEHYRRSLAGASDDQYLYDGRRVLPSSSDPKQRAEYELSWYVRKALPNEDAKTLARNALLTQKKMRGKGGAFYDSALSHLETLDATKAAYRKMAPGKLYQVDLAPKESDYLDWDRPLSEQSRKVRGIVAKAKIAADSLYGGEYNAVGWNDGLRGGDWYAKVAAAWSQELMPAEFDVLDGAQEAASKFLLSLGIPGIRYRDGASRGDWRVEFNKHGHFAREADSGKTSPYFKTEAEAQAWLDERTHHNYVLFDDSLVEVKSKLSRSSSAAGRADLPPRESLFNAAVRAPVQALRIDRVTGWAYDTLLDKLGAFVPEKVKAGIVSDYGIPEAVVDRRGVMQGHMRQALRQTQGIVDKLLDLTRAESRVAYDWMTTENPDDAALEQLPEESRDTLRQVKQLVASMGKEAVRLGQLSAEVQERNALSYLHRSYLKHELEAPEQAKANRARAVKILGEQYKGRGMVDGVAMSKIRNVAPDFWQRKLQAGRADKGLKGQTFLRFERRANRGEGVGVLPGMEAADQQGKLLEVAYWPTSEPVPARFGAWHEDASPWEVRDVQGDKLVLWRDFTKEERTRMGEIDEVKYAVAKTLHQMIHDIEVGRYLEWLANRYARPKGDGLKVVKASESLFRTFERDEWVKVPDSEIPGTSVKQYGKLAGHFIPGPIWNDVRQLTTQRYAPLGDVYATLLKAWKISKTALSPAVHLNNVMANVVMADWHDILASDLVNAIRTLVDSDDPANKRLLEAFEDNGGTQGMYVLSEIQRDQLRPLLDELRADVDRAGGAGMVNASSVLQAMLQSGPLGERLRAAAAAATDSKAVGAVKKAADAMIDFYQAEDTVFRLAAFIKAKAEGRSDVDAGKLARKSFLDYQINAPWVQMMRSTAFPFVSFVYRAVPMMLETFARKPWKLLKLGIVLGGLNALGYAMSGGDEDKERKLLPDEKRGRVLGLFPKLIRMPWNDAHGSPVFLDIRRFIPVGDLLDVDQTHSAIPVLPAMLPGGPLAVLAELALNKNQFTGREIVKETDTALEAAGKVFDHVYKAFAPNLGFLPGTYAFKAIADAGTGKTDPFGREQSLPMAAASGLGVKLAAYPADVAKRGIKLEHDAQVREIGENISRLRREYMQQGISREEFDEKVRDQIAKRRKITQEAAERLR